MALYEEDGKCGHYGFFRLLCFRCLASWLDPWPKCQGDSGSLRILFPYCFLSFQSFSSTFLSLCQNLLVGKALWTDRSELMPCSFRLDPARVLSDWSLTTSRQETKGYLPSPTAGISLPALCPASGILVLACLYNCILDFSLGFPVPWWCWASVQSLGCWTVVLSLCLDLASPWPWAGQRPLAMCHKPWCNSNLAGVTHHLQ